MTGPNELNGSNGFNGPNEPKEKPAITSTRPKDPKRVEAGKRLGQISKQIREQKMRQRIESEQGWGYGYLVGLVGLVLAALSVYYARAQHKREETVKPSESDKSEGVKTVRITKGPAVIRKPVLDNLG